MKPSSLLLSVSLSSLPLLAMSQSTAPVIQVIDDFDLASITYSPGSHWTDSKDLSCSECFLKPQLKQAWRGTFHYAFHPIIKDDDDKPQTQPPPNNVGATDPDAGPGDDKGGGNDGDEKTSTSSTKPSSTSSPPPAATSGGSGSESNDNDAHGDDDDSHGGKGKGKGGDQKRRRRSRLFRRDPDPDDPNFVDNPVMATVNFTGTGVSVFGIIPTLNSNQSALVMTNVTFLLDGKDFEKPFVSAPHLNTSIAPSFNYSVSLFNHQGLEDGQHILVIMPALGSMLFLDSINVTKSGDAANPTATVSGGIDSQMPPAENRKSVTTFAIAIGTTMGILAIVAASTFISLFYRRHKSARQAKIREAQEASLRPPSPEMRGPQPFIPRYFPGTVQRPLSISSGYSAGSSSSSSLGPSHGLNYPMAPEIPPFVGPPPPIRPRPQPQVQMTQSAPVALALSLRAPVTRVIDDEDNVPPAYNEVHTTALVTAPAYTPSTSLAAHSSISSSVALSDVISLPPPPPPLPENDLSTPPPLPEDEISPSSSLPETDSATFPISGPVPSRRSGELSHSSPSSGGDGPPASTRPSIPLTLPE